MLSQDHGMAPDGQPFKLITLHNQAGMEVMLMDWGATLLSCRVPLKDGHTREVLLGCETPEQYTHQAAFLGASIGRYANRIDSSQYTHDGLTVHLKPSQGEHQLHGGPEGFDKRRWEIISHDSQQAVLQLTSPDGDQGFPGNLTASVIYRVTPDNRIAIIYQAQVDKPCPVNLTNHAYFNLDGKKGDIRQHRLQLFAEQWLPVNSNGIPSGELADVQHTGFDFRGPKTIVEDFLRDENQAGVKGYDHAFLLTARGDASLPAAHVWSADNKLKMSVFTSAPALQFYSGNYLDGTPARQFTHYASFEGLALESEFLPDSPNHPEWPQPDCVLKPGETWQSITEYQFTAL